MWKQLKAAKEERGAIQQQMRTLMEASTNEKRDLSEQETTDFAGLETKLAAKEAEVRRLETVCGFTPDGTKPGNPSEQRNQPGRGDTTPDNKPIFETRDLTGYSLVRAISLMAKNQPLDGLEREASDEIAKRSGKAAEGFYFPTELTMERRALDTTTAAGLKATVTDAANFIEMLRERTVVTTLGARLLTGLVGDLSLPKQTAGGTASWVTEGNAPSGSNATVGQVGLAPKQLSAFTDMSRKFVNQSSLSAEQFVREDLAKTVAIAIDKAAINGSGSGAEPQGILQNGSVSTVAMGTNGAAPSWAKIVELETAVANANADLGALNYLTNSKVRGALKTTEKSSSTAQYIWRDDNTVNGYSAFATNLVPANLTKGTANAICSAAIFGNWADLLIGFWGGLDVLVDPYTGSSSGTVRVVVHQDADIKLRHAESFSKIVDLLA